jgi:hypothetical protein
MTVPDPAERAGRLAQWGAWRTLTDVVHTVADTWRLADESHSLLKRMEIAMADTSGLLNDVAAKLRDDVFPAVSDLLAENTRLAEENASLKGEDVRESAAAEAVRTRTDEVAALFTDSPDVPNVDPLPEPTPTPTDGGTTDVVNPTPTDDQGNPVPPQG